jgi:L-asparaginase
MAENTPKYRIVEVVRESGIRPESSVLIIYTGGTIGMEHDSSGSLVALNFNEIVKRAPSLKRLEVMLTVISFPTPIDSSNMSIKEWQNLGFIIYENYQHYDGFVVLHGTDTMAFTAAALSFMLQGLNKPVIFTGAQLPISAIRSDARPNLVTALEIASAKENGQAPLCRKYVFILIINCCGAIDLLKSAAANLQLLAAKTIPRWPRQGFQLLTTGILSRITILAEH